MYIPNVTIRSLDGNAGDGCFLGYTLAALGTAYNFLGHLLFAMGAIGRVAISL